MATGESADYGPDSRLPLRHRQVTDLVGEVPQEVRDLLRGGGLVVSDRWWTANWCRRARISTCKESRERQGSRSRARKVQTGVVKVESTIQEVEEQTR